MKKNTNLKSILTDQSITNEEVHEWVSDLFASLEDENGNLTIYNHGQVTVGQISAQKTTADRLYI